MQETTLEDRAIPLDTGNEQTLIKKTGEKSMALSDATLAKILWEIRTGEWESFFMECAENLYDNAIKDNPLPEIDAGQDATGGFLKMPKEVIETIARTSILRSYPTADNRLIDVLFIAKKLETWWSTSIRQMVRHA